VGTVADVTHAATLLLPLAPLFAALLSGCGGKSSCDDFKGGTYMKTVELSPEEYEQWSRGMPPGAPTGGANFPGATESAGDPAGTAGEVGGDDTAADTGAVLDDQEICMMVCASESAIGEVKSCTVGPVNAAGNIPVECVLPQFCEGRRHACVRSHGASGINTAPAAAWLARAAHDEAASVHAFLALAAELSALGAPAGLLARIDAAISDEVRHAALIADLALRHGAAIAPPTIAPTPPRDLLALAVENMVEGCVRETWAALSAAHQARHAATPALRELYAGIAADETRHAELAWAIDAWLHGQLGAAQRAMVAAAGQAAARRLHAELAALADEPGLQALGVPDRASALHLVRGLDAALWSQAA